MSIIKGIYQSWSILDSIPILIFVVATVMFYIIWNQPLAKTKIKTQQ